MSRIDGIDPYAVKYINAIIHESKPRGLKDRTIPPDGEFMNCVPYSVALSELSKPPSTRRLIIIQSEAPAPLFIKGVTITSSETDETALGLGFNPSALDKNRFGVSRFGGPERIELTHVAQVTEALIKVGGMLLRSNQGCLKLMTLQTYREQILGLPTG